MSRAAAFPRHALLLLLLPPLIQACPRQQVEQAPDAGPALPEPFTFTAESKPMLFSALDPSGEPVTADSVEGIPEQLRARVMVVDLSKSPEERQADRYVFFADLTKPDADGTFVARPMSRFKQPPRPAAAAAAPAPEGAVVIYTAAWCGFCKKAKAYLEQKGVEYVERDVEASAAAARELEQKLRAAGASGGGVPVIDIGGQLVMGFDPARIDALLAQLK